MLFKQRLWAGLADGSITVALRRWRRPSVKTGGTLQTPGGLLVIDAVERIGVDDVTDRDARAAGYADRARALAELRAEGDLYRIRFHGRGNDPRIDLRCRVDLDADELARVLGAFARLEWAIPVLTLIADNPATVSTELARRLGMERLPFKQRVRRLKQLGLTESLEVGYRLSPRGAEVLARVRDVPISPPGGDDEHLRP